MPKRTLQTDLAALIAAILRAGDAGSGQAFRGDCYYVGEAAAIIRLARNLSSLQHPKENTQ